MKKYVVPAIKLHELKAGSILNASGYENKGRMDQASINTQSYEYDKDFDSDKLFDE